MPLDGLKQWYMHRSKIGFTKGIQVTVTKVTFPGAIKHFNRGLNRLNNSFDCGFVANSLLAPLVMNYEPRTHRKLLFIQYIL